MLIVKTQTLEDERSMILCNSITETKAENGDIILNLYDKEWSESTLFLADLSALIVETIDGRTVHNFKIETIDSGGYRYVPQFGGCVDVGVDNTGASLSE